MFKINLNAKKYCVIVMIRKRSIIFLLIIFILQFASPSESISWDISEFSAPSGTINPNQNPPTTTGDGGIAEEQTLPAESLLSINKMIIPAKNESYILGESSRILVEIKNINKNIIKSGDNEIFIREIIDDGLGFKAESGKWKKVDFDELSRIKLSLLRSSSTNIEANNCTSWPIEYELFNLDNASKKNSPDQLKMIDTLYNIFDISWVIKDDVSVSPINNISGINITSPGGDWAQIVDNFDKSLTLKISDGRKYELKVNKKNDVIRYINDTDYYLAIYLDELSVDDTLLFWYDIYPKRSGTFKAETLVRFFDAEHARVHDLSYPFYIQIKQATPKFEVTPKPNKLQVYAGSGDSLDIIYDITYLGGGTEPTCNDVAVELDKPIEGYYYYVNQKGYRDDSLANRSSLTNYTSYDKYETKQIRRRVVYPNTGSYSLPGIWVNGEHYSFKEDRISVDTWWSRNENIISLYFAIISILITALGAFYAAMQLKRDMKELIRAVLFMSGKTMPGDANYKINNIYKKIIEQRTNLFPYIVVVVLVIVLAFAGLHYLIIK